MGEGNSSALSRIESLLGSLVVGLENSGYAAAILDLKASEGVPSMTVVPPLLKYGDFQLTGFEEVASLPLLLPTNVNAVFLDVGDLEKQVPNLFQNIICRLLLSMRMDLVKVFVVDMDLGNSFPLLPAIENPMFEKQVFGRDGIKKLILDLEEAVGVVNNKCSIYYENIEAHNADETQMALPYHFVFIDDFPEGFDNDSIIRLLGLIKNGNASKAGIKLFINYRRNNVRPRESDLCQFAEVCSCITNEDGRLAFQKWPLQLPHRITSSLETVLTKGVSSIVDYLKKIPVREESYSLDWWIEDLKKNDKVWSGSTVGGIKVPVGVKSNGEVFEFNIGTDLEGYNRDYFGLIAGRSGAGKTVLLQNIIINAALKYSPDELCLYLVDFAGGTGFNFFSELPHAKSIMIANDKDYALSMLLKLEEEFSNREKLYNNGYCQFHRNIKDLPSYREITGEKLPRILVIIDEAHKLFARGEDSVVARARSILEEAVREWRKYGISIVLCTQEIEEAGFGKAESKITYRFSFNLKPEQSRMAIGNNAAANLPPSRKVIMNNRLNGDEKANVEFLSAFSQHYDEDVKYLADLYENTYGGRRVPDIREYGEVVDITDNQKLSNYYDNNERPEPNYQSCDIYVGKPNLPRESHTRICYRRRPCSNTLILGEDFNTLIRNVAIQLLQLKWQSYKVSKFFIVDCSNEEQYQGAFEAFNRLEGFEVGNSNDISDYLNMAVGELERRKNEKKDGKETKTRVVLTILNAQNCDALLPIPDVSGHYMASEQNSQLRTLLIEGPSYGIHCIVHGLRYGIMFENPRSVLSSNILPFFENIICLNCSIGGGVADTLLRKKIHNPGKDWMMVDNAHIDGQEFEKCNPYKKSNLQTSDYAVEVVSAIFDKYR